MGWRGALRSIRATSRRIDREREQKRKRRQRSLTKLDRNVQQVLANARSLEGKIARDPIKALGLTYSPSNGFQSQPFRIETDVFSGEISLTAGGSTSQPPSTFAPNQYSSETSVIRPLDLLVSQFATILALEVSHSDPELRLKVNWIKKPDRSSSLVYLIDTEKSEYYYPISTDMTGEILPGHPRRGLIAFEPFRVPTSRIEIHFSNVKLAGARAKKASFAFSHIDESLGDVIQRTNERPALAKQVQDALDRAANSVRDRIAKPRNSGCLLLALSIILIVGIVLIA